MIWRTEEGYEFISIVESYGKLVDSSGDQWKDACEARSLMAVPLEERRRHMELMAQKRSGGDKGREAAILAHLETIVTREWKWRKEQKAKVAA